MQEKATSDKQITVTKAKIFFHFWLNLKINIKVRCKKYTIGILNDIFNILKVRFL